MISLAADHARDRDRESKRKRETGVFFIVGGGE